LSAADKGIADTARTGWCRHEIRAAGISPDRSLQKEKAVFLVALLLLLLLLGVVGGIVVAKFLFSVLLVAALVAVIAFLSRRTVQGRS
jgi:hypothetical protein